MLGELYNPQGLALETAQAVLEVEDPMACNVAVGCTNACKYCYVPLWMRKSRERCKEVRLPRELPEVLVERQLIKMKPERPEGVFLCFLTDPFIDVTAPLTQPLVKLLVEDWKVRVATCSKMGTSPFLKVRSGMTIVSADPKFWLEFEPNANSPENRIIELQLIDRVGGYTWAALEPYPVSAIWEQNILDLLEQIKFVKLIVFGKWNYDRRATTEEAKAEYLETIETLRDFCKSNHIRLHIKSDTLKRVGLLEE